MTSVLQIQTDRLAAEVDPDDPFSCQNAELWDSLTLEAFIDARIWTEGEIVCLAASYYNLICCFSGETFCSQCQ